MFGEIRKFYDLGDGLSGLLGGAGAGSALGPLGAVAGGLIGGITGLFQKKKGNKLLDQNVRPNQTLPAELLANQEDAKQMANEGLPSQQYDNANKNIQRQQVAAIGNAQDRRLGGALVGGIQQRTNDATANLDAADADNRKQGRINLQNVNNQVASWRDKLFDWNQKQKYIERQNYGMSLLGAGNANFYGGLDKVTSGLLGGLNYLNVGRQGQPQSPYQSEGTGLATTSAGYVPGSNTDVVLDPNAYSRF